MNSKEHKNKMLDLRDRLNKHKIKLEEHKKDIEQISARALELKMLIEQNKLNMGKLTDRIALLRERAEVLKEAVNAGYDISKIDPVMAFAAAFTMSENQFNLEFDEDYHCKCLNCGRVVLAGPPCCDDFKSQKMLDEENQDD